METGIQSSPGHWIFEKRVSRTSKEKKRLGRLKANFSIFFSIIRLDTGNYFLILKKKI